jgi:solute:Na+ symporter, SSS family
VKGPVIGEKGYFCAKITISGLPVQTKLHRMSSSLILIIFSAYTGLLFLVGYLTSRRSNEEAFYIGNRSSRWYLVAYGMVGASLSGVTFISIPGYVGASSFSYMVIVLGYLVGYVIIANVLLPVYYRLRLTSIYGYLDQRFGRFSYKTGASFFILSRLIGASFRVFIVVNVLYLFVFKPWGVPFEAVVILFVLLILLYSIKGGIKTIVWTDTLQTTFMIAALVVTIFLLARGWEGGIAALTSDVISSSYSKIFFFTEWQDRNYFLKLFFSGMFITIVMTGLDQDMMQKNLSCRTYKESRKNMYWMSAILVPVNLLFLFLGASLYLYASKNGIAIPEMTDDLFPTIALKYLGGFAGITFFLGLIAAAYSSADGTLTALTTSITIDLLGLPERAGMDEQSRKRFRLLVHIGVTALVTVTIMLFGAINDRAVIEKLFDIAGYTYGPLLGLYAFGLFTKFAIRDKVVPIIAVISPILAYGSKLLLEHSIQGYKVGFEILIMNGLITFLMLCAIIRKTKTTIPSNSELI